jgi:hypothetical protein
MIDRKKNGSCERKEEERELKNNRVMDKVEC